MKIRSLLAVLAGGALFGFGLALSTMIEPEVVLSFLRLHDLGLLLVLGGAASVTLVEQAPERGRSGGRGGSTHRRRGRDRR